MHYTQQIIGNYHRGGIAKAQVEAKIENPHDKTFLIAKISDMIDILRNMRAFPLIRQRKRERETERIPTHGI